MKQDSAPERSPARRPAGGAAGPGVLQRTLFRGPDADAPHEIHVRASAGVRLQDDGRALAFDAGAVAGFDTYANIFNLARWRTHCDLRSLSLSVEGEGTFRVRVHATGEDRSRRVLHDETVTLQPDVPCRLPLPLERAGAQRTLLSCELTSDTPGTLTRLDWCSDDSPRRSPRILVVMTAYGQVDSARDAARRFDAFARAQDLGGSIRLLVVDNSRQLGTLDLSHAAALANPNYGGSGGFARGLLEARRQGFSHCVFMDDDAAIDLELLLRVRAFYAFAKDGNIAVPGALLQAQNPRYLWECGAVFDRMCRSLFRGLDISRRDGVCDVEFATTGAQPPNFYGGWWFFAFPVAAVRRFPFPFFVRGDDISFSLNNDFRFVPLTGLACDQDLDFPDKESPVTNYLDLRMHLVQQITAPMLTASRLNALVPLVIFFRKCMISYSYPSIDAMVHAIRDVRDGPAAFGDQPRTEARLAGIRAAAGTERWTEGRPPETAGSPPPRALRWLYACTSNGHLMPFLGRAYRPALPSALRHDARILGTRELIFVHRDGQRYMTLRMDRRRALRAWFGYWRAAAGFLLRLPRTRDLWRRDYATFASARYWNDLFGLDDTRETASGPAGRTEDG